ncbi:uncharacterized protein EDB93DRAFT_1250491 [Suillus bovinus]|uniref:uncharacterized protein n=1 Tax=Suillus bovinus TaxID=48563 RepID=UPI001B86010B|nr:uncharacterized protein EDB93DRAFT_1250491 [Suillus bovinus]KAG2147776.1 hypothetical protein EDB93DRAFT_1250491 [Suillus bovinus]
MTCVIKDTSPALDAVIKLLSVLNLTDNDRTVIATKLLSDIGEPRGGACAANTVDLQTSSSLSVDAEPADAKSSAVPKISSSITPTAAPTASVVTVVDNTGLSTAPAAPTIALPSVVTVVDDGDDVYDAIAEGCMLNAYKHVYFNVPLSSDAAQPLYYVTRGRKISVFSGWGNVGPKVLGVSRTIFGRVENIDQGIEALIAAIDAGTAVQV